MTWGPDWAPHLLLVWIPSFRWIRGNSHHFDIRVPRYEEDIRRWIAGLAQIYLQYEAIPFCLGYYFGRNRQKKLADGSTGGRNECRQVTYEKRRKNRKEEKCLPLCDGLVFLTRRHYFLFSASVPVLVIKIIEDNKLHSLFYSDVEPTATSPSSFPNPRI